MKRREFITLLGGAAAWPMAARAQSSNRVRLPTALMPCTYRGRQLHTWIASLTVPSQLICQSSSRQSLSDIFLDIVELQTKIGRDPAERAAREASESPADQHGY